LLSKLEPGGGTGILANHSSREAIAAIWITRHKDDFYDEEPDNGFLESLRHKSFKRAILPKVDEEKRWTDSMRDLRVAKDVGAVIIGCQPPGSEGQVWRGGVRLCTTMAGRGPRGRINDKVKLSTTTGTERRGKGFRIGSPPSQLLKVPPVGLENYCGHWRLCFRSCCSQTRASKKRRARKKIRIRLSRHI